MQFVYRLDRIDLKSPAQLDGIEYRHPKANAERLKRLRSFVTPDEARRIEISFTFDETTRTLRVAEITLPLGDSTLLDRLNTVMPPSAALSTSQSYVTGVQVEVLLQSLPAPAPQRGIP